MVQDRDLTEDGFAIVNGVLEEDVITSLLQELQPHLTQQPASTSNRMYALRNLFQKMPSIRALAESQRLRSLVEPYLGAGCFAVRALYFYKLPGSNWIVPWHQDLTVALQSRREVEGFGPWSRKDGVLHAQAPADLLTRMLTVRLHLDACPATNGALRVLPGTHALGKLDSCQIQTWCSHLKEVVCEVERGGALLMRPLLLHASSAARSPDHRRVIHLEYASSVLPEGLQWHEVVSPANP